MGIRAIRVASLLAVALLLPVLVHAQSQFTGQVRDESGGVLPGVLVEASSPALIEKSKTAITDEQGRYTIVDLRPGVYRVTFTLTGFSTIVRPEVELPSNFVATINADMKLGSLAETITVSGQAPMVDVTQASRTDVVTRDMLDVLPTTRHVFSVSNMLPGIRFATPDIGGSRQMEQTAPRGHGVNGAQAQEAIDGMSTSSQESNIVWTYVNDSVVQEVTVTTAAHPAEVQAGAMRMNMIPKDGGNVFSGSVFLGGSDGSWQAKNIDDYLRSQNVTSGNGIAHVQTFNGITRRADHAESPVVLRHDASRVDRRGGRERRRGHRDTAGRAAQKHHRSIHPRRAGASDVADQPEEQVCGVFQPHVEAQGKRLRGRVPIRAPGHIAIRARASTRSARQSTQTR